MIRILILIIITVATVLVMVMVIILRRITGSKNHPFNQNIFIVQLPAVRREVWIGDLSHFA